MSAAVFTVVTDEEGDRVQTFCMSPGEWDATLYDGGGEHLCASEGWVATEAEALAALRVALLADFTRRCALIDAALAKVAK